MTDTTRADLPARQRTGWTGNSLADMALILLDRIDTKDDDRIDQLEELVREMAAGLAAQPAHVANRLAKALRPLANASAPIERELLTDADVQAAQDALSQYEASPPAPVAEQAEEVKPMEMALCEAHRLVLRVGQPYVFRPVEGCGTCAAMLKSAIDAYGPGAGSPHPVAEREWSPIETAPRDGTRLLLHPAVEVCDAWSKGHWSELERNWIVGGSVMGHEPTHWMPLPPAPPSPPQPRTHSHDQPRSPSAHRCDARVQRSTGPNRL